MAKKINKELTYEEQMQKLLDSRTKSFRNEVRKEIMTKGLRSAELTLEYYTKHDNVKYNEDALGLTRKQIISIYEKCIAEHKGDIQAKKAITRNIK